MTPTNPTGAQALSDEQIIRLAYQHLSTWDQDTIRFARAVLALAGREQAGAVADEIEQLWEQRDALMRALEVIAVGDSSDPVRDAGDELVGLGYWRKEGLAEHRSLTAPGAAIAAREQDKCADCGDAVPKGVCYCRENCVHAVGYASPKEAPATPQGETSGPKLSKKDLNKLLNDFARACTTYSDEPLARMAATKAIHEYLDAAFAALQGMQPGER